MRAVTYEEKINVASVALTGGFCFAFPYYVWDWLYEAYFDRDRLQRIETKQSFDSLYANIEIDKGPQALAFILAFLVRRLLLAFVIG